MDTLYHKIAINTKKEPGGPFLRTDILKFTTGRLGSSAGL